MPWFDLPAAALQEYRTGAPEPPGLDGWWAERLDEARKVPRPPGVTRYRADAYRQPHAYDLEFSGARGDRIRGWYRSGVLHLGELRRENPVPLSLGCRIKRFIVYMTCLAA
jgi:cephalosporin-C deacetylase-like acetyl esterase